MNTAAQALIKMRRRGKPQKMNMDYIPATGIQFIISLTVTVISVAHSDSNCLLYIIYYIYSSYTLDWPGSLNDISLIVAVAAPQLPYFLRLYSGHITVIGVIEIIVDSGRKTISIISATLLLKLDQIGLVFFLALQHDEKSIP
ncbi:hypothetical protein JOB18_044848 [Solea senegalensis]|uniref:Uncharacterized protein n=1 Tax=Solea senegalensis TaxID=28829 RepID=A0AAV6RG65_SOLSE|nr:hypothetical protein JOB18_044848 [Solea senegalensis]